MGIFYLDIWNIYFLSYFQRQHHHCSNVKLVNWQKVIVFFFQQVWMKVLCHLCLCILMFRDLQKSQHWMDLDGLFLLLMIIVIWLGYVWWRISRRFALYSNNFIWWLLLSIKPQSKFFELTMVENLSIMSWSNYCTFIASFIKLYVHIPLNKMALLKEKIDIF